MSPADYRARVEKFTDSRWEIFVLMHRRRGNILFHWMSFLMFYGIPAAALWYKQPLWMLFWPLSSVIGVLGHFLFEPETVYLKNAFFNLPTLGCLNRMFWLLIRGRYQLESQKITGRFELFCKQISS